MLSYLAFLTVHRRSFHAINKYQAYKQKSRQDLLLALNARAFQVKSMTTPLRVSSKSKQDITSYHQAIRLINAISTQTD